MINSDFLSIFLIAIGLSADCFAVALGGGSSNINHSWPRLLRVSFSFGLFQALMPLLGWLAGRTMVEFIADYDHWVAFALLAIVSVRMLWESFRPEHSPGKEVDITKGLLLITLSVATSIDALAVGLSFAFLKVNIAVASLTIGAVAFLVTTIGFLVGNRASKIIGKRAEALGGIILLAIAFRILLSHTLSGE
ncbi:MAG: manganese efflux pump [Chloroflexi bacterium]|nr:manganese efflux pump [Chloroflexota bacterium]MBI3040262.1 manganese efflux pump [Chloroflexota bacterium]MBI3931125.1 manganese efflux pump [Chloroflexota bacterium]